MGCVYTRGSAVDGGVGESRAGDVSSSSSSPFGSFSACAVEGETRGVADGGGRWSSGAGGECGEDGDAEPAFKVPRRAGGGCDGDGRDAGSSVVGCEPLGVSVVAEVVGRRGWGLDSDCPVSPASDGCGRGGGGREWGHGGRDGDGVGGGVGVGVGGAGGCGCGRRERVISGCVCGRGGHVEDSSSVCGPHHGHSSGSGSSQSLPISPLLHSSDGGRRRCTTAGTGGAYRAGPGDMGLDGAGALRGDGCGAGNDVGVGGCSAHASPVERGDEAGGAEHGVDAGECAHASGASAGGVFPASGSGAGAGAGGDGYAGYGSVRLYSPERGLVVLKRLERQQESATFGGGGSLGVGVGGDNSLAGSGSGCGAAGQEAVEGEHLAGPPDAGDAGGGAAPQRDVSGSSREAGAPVGVKRRGVRYARAYELMMNELVGTGESLDISEKLCLQEADLRGRVVVANSKCGCGYCRDVVHMGWKKWNEFYMSLLFTSVRGADVRKGCLCVEPFLNRRHVLSCLEAFSA